ncbi:hypothetical protein PPL_02038 [Heterostelium album PN500]|uniref:Uncharacterized protein n=1 Tax=Heterostelium pallidum (strain ATCC 26659 / Pp 5 / PN500) TaxID=670386 RepID=D3B168_HETP5|nr:hypothetical protein PPL_02038 [Heterostelium album PN500]EFA85042.1 hypothetical protein PPL_02038 [Heterostelium album PN500]|eukprot:XP_020437152.1 hypothetical protein PPL_02038 [Heterostelium album PN500]
MNIVKSVSLMLVVLFLLAVVNAAPCCEKCNEDDWRCTSNCIDCNRPTTFMTIPPWPEPTPFPSTTGKPTTTTTTTPSTAPPTSTPSTAPPTSTPSTAPPTSTPTTTSTTTK